MDCKVKKHKHETFPPGEKIQVLTTPSPHSQMEPLNLGLGGTTERTPGKRVCIAITNYCVCSLLLSLWL